MESLDLSSGWPLQVAYGGVLLLLVGVTGGIVYLTLAEWRDRRRIEQAAPPKRVAKKR